MDLINPLRKGNRDGMVEKDTTAFGKAHAGIRRRYEGYSLVRRLR